MQRAERAGSFRFVALPTGQRIWVIVAGSEIFRFVHARRLVEGAWVPHLIDSSHGVGRFSERRAECLSKAARAETSKPPATWVGRLEKDYQSFAARPVALPQCVIPCVQRPS